MEDHNLQDGRTEIFCIELHKCFVCFVETFGACNVHHHYTVKNWAPRVTFFRNHEPNHVTGVSLTHLQNMPNYFPPGKYKLSICSSLVLLMQSFSCIIFCAFKKGCLVLDDRNLHTIFSALILTIICMKLLTLITQPFQYHF